MKKFRKEKRKNAVIKCLSSVFMSFALIASSFSMNTVTALAEETVSDAASTIRMTGTEGSVAVTDSTGKELSQVDNMRLYSGNQISTDTESYAYFNLDDTKAVKLADLSSAEIRQNKKNLEVLLESGGLYFDVSEKLQKNENMKVRASNMVMGIRGTDADLAVNDDGSITARLYTGKLEGTVTNTDTGKTSAFKMEAGQSATISNSSEDNTPQVSLDNVKISDVPGYVMQEIVSNGRTEEVFNASGLDMRDITTEEINKKIRSEQQVKIITSAEKKNEFTEQENNKSKNNVWHAAKNSNVVSTPAGSKKIDPNSTTQGQAATNGTSTQSGSGTSKSSSEGTSVSSSGGSTNSSSDGSSSGSSSGNSSSQEEKEEEEKYAVDVADTDNGKIKVSKEEAKEGATVTVTVTPDDGYVLKKLTVTNKKTDKTVSTTKKSDNVYSFEMPAAGVKIKATFEKTYSVTVGTIENGTVTANPTSATKGTSVTLTATANDGYELSTIEAKTKSGTAVTLSGDGNTRTFTMPAENVTVSATFTATAEPTYTVTVGTIENGTVTANPTSAVKGTSVTLTAVPNDGYELSTIEAKTESGTSVTLWGDGNTRTFTMPAENVTVSATYTATAEPTYTVTVGTIENGTVTASPTSAAKGTSVTLTAAPNDGYVLSAIEAKTESGTSVTLSGDGNTRTFTMPEENVTVTATFISPRKRFSFSSGIMVLKSVTQMQ